MLNINFRNLFQKESYKIYKNYVFWGLFLIFVLIQLWLHLNASLTFPIPWPDEANFL